MISAFDDCDIFSVQLSRTITGDRALHAVTNTRTTTTCHRSGCWFCQSPLPCLYLLPWSNTHSLSSLLKESYWFTSHVNNNNTPLEDGITERYYNNPLQQPKKGRASFTPSFLYITQQQSQCTLIQKQNKTRLWRRRRQKSLANQHNYTKESAAKTRKNKNKITRHKHTQKHYHHHHHKQYHCRHLWRSAQEDIFCKPLTILLLSKHTQPLSISFLDQIFPQKHSFERPWSRASAAGRQAHRRWKN
jgi:hypothetical protein